MSNKIGPIIVGAAIATAALYGCTQADVADFTTIGSPGHIRCYSGSYLFYEGESTGKIDTVSQSDGWQFVDAKTHKFVRVSGSCIIEN
jgi:hypothetical protein